MNVGENTIITGIEASRGYIAHALQAKGLHRIQYAHFDPRVQRGIVEVLTDDGWIEAKFRCECGWLTYLEFSGGEDERIYHI